MEVLDRRAALEEAFDMSEADAKGETYTPPVREENAETEPEASNIIPLEVEKDPADVEAEAATRKEPKPRTKGVPISERKAPTAETKAVPSADGEVKAPSSAEKAPVAWGVNRDALWAKVPSDVRALINKRETEIQQGMSQAGRIRQIAEEYHSLITPYDQVIRSMNTTPKEAINSVMQTATMMVVGTQAQKVAILAEMVDRYGVDLAELDQGLTRMLEAKKGGRINPHAPPQQMPPEILSQLKPLFDLQQRLVAAEGQKSQKLEYEAAEAINSVASEQFFEDVRDDMADVLEIAAKRGIVMTIQQAYAKACQLHPEVSKLYQAKIAKPAIDSNRRRRAASTVKGSPGGAVLNATQDRRSQIEDAWNQQA